MRILISKIDGRLIEMQSNPTPGTLIENAKRAGFNEIDVEEKEITKEEWENIKEKTFNEPERKRNKEMEGLKRKAIDKLKLLGLSEEEINALILKK